MKLPRTASTPILAALAVAAGCFALLPARAAEPAPSYRDRPIYSDPVNGLQLPPSCIIEPTWRARLSSAEMEVWVLSCDSVARVWLVTRQIVEMLSSHEGRLRFVVVDERMLPEEVAGDSLSVQCTDTNDAPGIVVYGAHWHAAGRELHLASARGALRSDVARRRLTDTELGGVDCIRFPDREAMMRKLQQPERPAR